MKGNHKQGMIYHVLVLSSWDYVIDCLEKGGKGEDGESRKFLLKRNKYYEKVFGYVRFCKKS